MSFYEYLRRLYVKELYLIIILTIPFVFYLQFALQNTALAHIVACACIPTFIELYLLKKEKNIDTYRSLVLPRTIHFAAYYSIIMIISLFYPALRFEYMLFIPLGISAMAFHPFFGKRIKDILFIVGLISACVLIVNEYYKESYAEPIGPQNFLLLAYVFLITTIFIYQATVVNEESKSILKSSKEDLEKKIIEINEVNQNLDSFTHSIMLDFKSVLASIDANFEYIAKASPESKKLAYEGQKEARKLNTLSDQLISKRQKGANITLPKIVDLNQLVLSELVRHESLLESKNIHVSFEPYSGDFFYSDQGKVQTIISSLLDNAIKYMDPAKAKQLIKISINTVNDKVFLKVSDNGIGIPEGEKENIFKMFYRLCKTVAGDGIGLYTANEAVKMIDGTLRVISQNGQGSEFIAEMPSKKIG